MYPPRVLDLTDRVLNHLAVDKNLEDLTEEGLSPFRRLASAASRDIADGELPPYSTALAEFAMRVSDGRLWCPVVELAGCWA